MLLALLPLLLPAAAAFPLPQESAAEADKTYQGPHCSFSYKKDAKVSEYGTGWGVVAELHSTKVADGSQQPLLRVTSVLSTADAADLAGQLVDLDREEIAANAWVMDADGVSVTRVIDGAERSGTQYGLSRDAGEGTYALFAWGHEGSVNLVRTIVRNQDHQDIVDACINGLTVRGMKPDSKRKIGIREYGFQIPANWMSSFQGLPSDMSLFTISFPSGKVEILITGPGYPDALEDFIDRAMGDATSKFISASVSDDNLGTYLGKRRSWLHAEGSLVQGLIHQWKDASGTLYEYPLFAYIPEGVNRVIQIQLSPNPGANENLLAELGGVTRSEIYREQAQGPHQDSVSFPGFSVSLPSGMERFDLLRDTFADGTGVVLGAANDGGPRMFFWNIPHKIDPAELPELQAAWLQKWLDRDFKGAEVLQRQTIGVEIPNAGTYQGVAWTVKHTQADTEGTLDWIHSATRDWMCTAVAIPYGDQTLLAIMQVDNRDRGPMFDEYREAIKRTYTSRSLGVSAEGFALALSQGSPWAVFQHPGEVYEEYVFLHKYGRVRAALHHFSSEDIENEVPKTWPARGASTRQEQRVKAKGGELGRSAHYGFIKLGARIVPYHHFGYTTSKEQIQFMQFSDWMEGNTQVIWSIEPGKHHSIFLKDAPELTPAGGTPTDFHSSSFSYQGLRLPTPEPFEWVGRGGFITQQHSLKFDSVLGFDVSLEFLADPGESYSDRDLLNAFLPQAPEWNPLGALHTVEVESEIFGRTVTGLRRTGLPMDGESRWDEVYVDRNQGTLRILRIGSSRNLVEAAYPAIRELIAGIRPEENDYVMNPNLVSKEAKAKLTIQEVGPISLALPEGFSEVKENEEATGITWSNGLGMSLTVFTLGSNEALSDVMTSFIANAKQSPSEPAFGEDPPMAPYSFLALVDGRTCPGIGLQLQGAPTFMVAVTQGKLNYIVMANSWTEKDTRDLLWEALIATKLDSPIFRPSW